MLNGVLENGTGCREFMDIGTNGEKKELHYSGAG
jgi:hypothetical protein